jgi:tetratricopeptide (TPR) repeat protein
MKRALLLLLFIPGLVAAQKPVKPNINKAQTLWKEGKLAEAKEMIDLASTYEKTKDDGKTFYYKGLIYTTLDTSSNDAVKAIAPANALDTAVAAFVKADKLGGKAANSYFITTADNQILIKDNQIAILADYYLNEGLDFLQADEPDYNASAEQIIKSTKVFEAQIPTYRNDTLAYYLLGLAHNGAEKFDDAIEAFGKYLKKGGKSKDVFFTLYQIYKGPKEDKEKALVVVREGRKANPTISDFPRLEIGLLIDLNRVAEAKDNLEAAVAKEPNDKILHFYLGYTYSQLKDKEKAIKEFRETLRIDPNYFEAQYYLAMEYFADVDVVNKQLNSLSSSAADQKRRQPLYLERVKKAEETIPYFEKAASLVEKTANQKQADKDNLIDVLERLSVLYYYSVNDAKEKQVKERLKALGVKDE